MTAETLSNDIQSEFVSRFDDAEQLLREIVAEDRKPYASEQAYFAREMGWVDPLEVRRELSRMKSVASWQAIAGLPQDREAAIEEAATSAKILESESPKLEQKIGELQAKLRAIENDARLSAKRVEQRADAVEQLRRLAPKYICDAVNHSIAQVEQSIGDKLREMVIRFQSLKSILNIDSIHKTNRSRLESLRLLCREATIESVTAGIITYQFSPAWPAIQAEAQSEFAELAEKIPVVQADYDAAIEQAEAPRSFYAIGPQPE